MDKFILDEKNYKIYKKYSKLEKEKHERIDQVYKPLKNINIDRFEFSNKDIKNKNPNSSFRFHPKSCSGSGWPLSLRIVRG